MKNFKFKTPGFTLIELLIVITIIGVLAAALFLGLNPIEQVNKGRDTGLISRAKEVVNACDRYRLANDACPASCEAMAPPAGNELRNTATCTDVTFTSAHCSVDGECTAEVTVRSSFYKTVCGDATCLVPAELGGLL